MLLTPSRSVGLRRTLLAVTTLVMVALLVPMVFVVVLSFGSSRWLVFPPPGWTLAWYRALLDKPEWIESFWKSLEIGLYVTALSLLLAVPAAFALTRGTFRGRGLVQGVLTAPMIVPVVILAIAIYALVLRTGLAGTKIGLTLSHTVIAIPFVALMVSNSLRGFDRSIEQAAMICGASPATTLLRITFPSIRRGLFAGGLFAFLTSWDEVVLSIFMSGPTLQTLPVRMWSSLRSNLSPEIAAVASVMLIVTAILMLLIHVANRRTA